MTQLQLSHLLCHSILEKKEVLLNSCKCGFYTDVMQKRAAQRLWTWGELIFVNAAEFYCFCCVDIYNVAAWKPLTSYLWSSEKITKG